MIPSVFPQNDNFQKLLNNYISFFDDPRITIDTVKEYVASTNTEDEFDDSEYWLEQYFEKNFENSNVEGIRYPIKSVSELEDRCIEILHLFSPENTHHISRPATFALLKMSFNVERIGHEYFYDVNPERTIAEHFINMMRYNASSFLTNSALLTDDDFDYNKGYSIALMKISIYTNSLIWTRSNVGNAMHEEATNLDKKIYQERSSQGVEKLKENLKKLKESK